MNDRTSSPARLSLVDPLTAPPEMVGFSDEDIIGSWQLFRRTMAGVDARLSAALAGPNPLSSQSCEALARLAAAPDRMLPMTELAGGVGLTSGGMTKLVDRLVLAGLVDRHHSTTDRRVVLAVLTDSGAAYEKLTTSAYVDHLRSEFAGLGVDGINALRAVCLQIEQSFQAGQAALGLTQHAEGARSRG